MNQNTDLLHDVTRWWATRDELGGFRTAGEILFGQWKPGHSCRPPDRPRDPEGSFAIHKNEYGAWFFRNYSLGYSGGLVEFVMRTGRSKSDSFLWLIDTAGNALNNFPSGPKAWLPAPRDRHINFFNPDELRAYEPDSGLSLVGDSHVIRGDVFLIGGEPGIGKSRGVTSLAIAGAKGGGSWFGLKVHRQFRTLIIQTENSRYRLRQEFSKLDTAPLVPWIRISEPPPFGLNLSSSDNGEEFKTDIRLAIDDFKPDCVILDPWNAAARDDRQREYAAAFQVLRSILPTGADRPALGVVAHTCKPRSNQKRAGGAGLKHLLAGSYLLSAIPRTLFILTRASDSETDPRVLFFNPKNNDGIPAAHSAWTRTASGFDPLPGFDWEAFDNPASDNGRNIVTIDHIRALFADNSQLELTDAAVRLSKMLGVAKRTAYAALDNNGRFSRHLIRDGSTIKFRP